MNCIKKPAISRLFSDRLSLLSGLHIPDMRIQTAFMSGSLVFMHQALARHTVDNRYSFFISFSRRFSIARRDGFDYVFNVRAQHGALTAVVLPASVSLSCAFFCLCRVCHD